VYAGGLVHDLVVGDDGALRVAGERGLFRLGPGASAERISTPGLGRPVWRFARAPGWRLLAGPDGLLVAAGGGLLTALAGPLAGRPVQALAARSQPGGRLRVYAASAGELWQLELAAGEATVRTDDAQRVPMPVGAGVIHDLRCDLPGSQLVAVLDDGFWIRDATGWRLERPVLPPGVRAARVLFAAGQLWLATSGGLLQAHRLQGPWARVAAPVGTDPVAALAGDQDRVLAVGPRGVYAAGPPPPDVADVDPRAASAEEPAIRQVQHAVIRHLRLGVRDLQQLRQRARRRGFWPELELRGGYRRRRIHDRDWDEAFTSGAYHRLFDRERNSEREHEILAVLRWDLGDAVFHPEEIDASRETREWLELRDEILDEVTQQYFERRRALHEAALATPGSPESERLRLRAAEMAAGIDAWTGGWWSHQLAPSVAPPPESR
jgi:hypothetical protein